MVTSSQPHNKDKWRAAATFPDPHIFWFCPIVHLQTTRCFIHIWHARMLAGMFQQTGYYCGRARWSPAVMTALLQIVSKALSARCTKNSTAAYMKRMFCGAQPPHPLYPQKPPPDKLYATGVMGDGEYLRPPDVVQATRPERIPVLLAGCDSSDVRAALVSEASTPKQFLAT